MHDIKVNELLNHTFLIELSEDEACSRRTQARDARLNPNPLTKADFDDLVWPTHERYMMDLAALSIITLRSPMNPAERDKLVQEICRSVGLGKSESLDALVAPTSGYPQCT